MKEIDVRISAGLAIAIFVGILYFRESLGFSDIGSALASAVSTVVLARYLFIKWVWKWLPQLNKFHGIPNIEGIWSGNYQSNYIDKETGKKKTGSVTVSISQPTIFSVKISQDSPDSNSNSCAEQLKIKSDGSAELIYTYLVEPKATVRDHHQISYGSAKYHLTLEENAFKLKGNYWTDQGSTGYIEMSQK